jgi:PPOX class probable F420-dependent enzyme
MSSAEWHAFLEEQRTAVLSSADRQAYPHLVAMWYLPQDDGLVMWTYAKSQKTQNLRRNPRVGVLVEAGERYDELRGVLIQADAELVDDFEQVYQAGLALHARYSEGGGAGTAAAEAGVRAQAEKRLLIRVPYAHVISWDHRRLTGRHRTHD